MSLIKPVVISVGLVCLFGLTFACASAFDGPGDGTSNSEVNTIVKSESKPAGQPAVAVLPSPETPLQQSQPTAGTDGSTQDPALSDEEVATAASKAAAGVATALQTRTANIALENKLAKKCEPIQGGDSLKALLDFMAEVHRFQFVPDKRVLRAKGIELKNATVDEDLSISDVTVQSALNIVLTQTDAKAELDYIVQDEVLRITTREVADAYRETRIYDLSKAAAAGMPMDQLVLAVSSAVDFKKAKGTLIRAVGKRLLVKHSQRSHREIANLVLQLNSNGKK